MKTRIFVLVLCALLIASSGAFADHGGKGKCCMMDKCGMMDGRGKMMFKMDKDDMFFKKAHFLLENASEIGLTDDQVAKIKAQKYALKKSKIKKSADIKIFALDIKEELGKDTVDLNNLKNMIDKKYAAKAEKAKELAEAYVNLKNILTKEQQKKLKDLCAGGKYGKKMEEPDEEDDKGQE